MSHHILATASTDLRLQVSFSPCISMIESLDWQESCFTLKQYFRCDWTLKWKATMAVGENKEKSKRAKLKDSSSKKQQYRFEKNLDTKDATYSL